MAEEGRGIGKERVGRRGMPRRRRGRGRHRQTGKGRSPGGGWGVKTQKRGRRKCEK